ncbi:Ankyrin repeat domain-containing protein 1 [Phytophthora cinnamomi]|uniref:Ankyrin repeat domain-containing protein 1 n=1 Tax=Phytophthora cinnamomi TaxID=4785 RepID=UPI00355A28C9|nr:Ankyrin repeat domain-containing protein 1 [Phytophthora cinnamomi]
MRGAEQEQEVEGDDPREVERRRVEYLRRHREQIQQRYRLDAERRAEELEADVAAMNARRDDVRAAKAAEEDEKSDGNAATSALKPARSLPSIYARFDDLGGEELQLLANRLQAASGQTQLNLRGKYHARYMRDAYPIAGSQLTLERQREMEAAAKKKLLLSDASLLAGKGSYGSKKKGGVLSLGLERAHGRSKLEHYVGKLATHLKGEQEQVRRSEAERQIRLCEVQHREGMEQFWRLLHAAPKREVIAWLKFHSFLDVNVPLVAPCALISFSACWTTAQ